MSNLISAIFSNHASFLVAFLLSTLFLSCLHDVYKSKKKNNVRTKRYAIEVKGVIE